MRSGRGASNTGGSGERAGEGQEGGDGAPKM